MNIICQIYLDVNPKPCFESIKSGNECVQLLHLDSINGCDFFQNKCCCFIVQNFQNNYDENNGIPTNDKQNELLTPSLPHRNGEQVESQLESPLMLAEHVGSIVKLLSSSLKFA